jgi:tetratricopeptide (TPR) repeat protein
LEESRRTDNFDKDKINLIYYRLSLTECHLSHCHNSLGDHDEAANYCDMALSHARRVIIEEDKIRLTYEALMTKGYNFQSQSKYNEAKTAYEEVYNFMVEIHYPDHPLVLEAANRMISVLTVLEEYEDAERYARICYECCTRPIDTESEEVADAAVELAHVTSKLILNGKDGDIVEAEMLARKSLRIMQKIYGSNTSNTCPDKITLSNILSAKCGNHENERKSLLEQCLASYVKLQAGDGNFVARANDGLAKVHYRIASKLPPGDAKIEQFHIAATYSKEYVRISSKIHGCTHPQTIDFQSYLSFIMRSSLMHNP